MSKLKYRIDMAKRVIYVDANYLKMSQNPKTRAYKTVSELIDMHPTFEVKAEGVAKDRYNHLTYQTMENFFTKNGMYDALEQFNKYRNDKTLDNKNGRNIRRYNMGAIRSWFIKHYGVEARKQGYLEENEDVADAGKAFENNSNETTNETPVAVVTQNEDKPKTVSETDDHTVMPQASVPNTTEESSEKKGA